MPRCPRRCSALGFGFVEVGTLTPRPQAGNPEAAPVPAGRGPGGDQPHGLQQSRPGGARSSGFAKRRRRGGIVGVNIGANKDSADRIADYVAGVRAMSAGRGLSHHQHLLAQHAGPARHLQDEGALDELLAAVREARGAGGPPLFLKVAPDLGEARSGAIVRVGARPRDRRADRRQHDRLAAAAAVAPRGRGGRPSGAPLKPLALDALRDFRRASGGEIPLIGVGGIASADDAWERIRAGASLVQLYTALVYEGPGLARRIARGLAALLARDGFANIAEAVGSG